MAAPGQEEWHSRSEGAQRPAADHTRSVRETESELFSSLDPRDTARFPPRHPHDYNFHRVEIWDP